MALDGRPGGPGAPPAAAARRDRAQVEAVLPPSGRIDPEATATGSRLFTTLFGQVPRRFSRHHRWLLSLDQTLFDVPMAALVEGHGTARAYWPSATLSKLSPGPCCGWSPPPVPRRGRAHFPGNRRRHIQCRRSAPARPASCPAGFAVEPVRGRSRRRGRLRSLCPGWWRARPELAACAHAWQGEHTLLEGAEASRGRLTEELRRNPAVIHFATHFVASAENALYLVSEGSQARSQAGAIGLIALSLNQAGETELLTAPEIAQWQVRAELVTLSGCHSAAGAALPGAGLMGLTRAWLAAGARSVVGSLWDTPDDSGELFAAFYRNLSGRRPADPALALDAAQREMIRTGGRLAQPRYWSAYFVVANE